jgi:hypothetical protein
MGDSRAQAIRISSGSAQGSSTLQELSFLQASFSTTAQTSPFKGPSAARGGCFLLQSSISRPCLLCSDWTRSNHDSNSTR